MRIGSAFLAPLLILAACGSPDPTPPPEEAANAVQINESVEAATNDQQAAEAIVENRQDAEERAQEQ